MSAKMLEERRKKKENPFKVVPGLEPRLPEYFNFKLKIKIRCANHYTIQPFTFKV